MPLAPGFYWAKENSRSAWTPIRVVDAQIGDDENILVLGGEDWWSESDFFAIRTDLPLTPPED